MKPFILLFLIFAESAFMGLAEAAPGHSDVQFNEMDVTQFIEDTGSFLPRRVEDFSRQFDEHLSFHTPNSTYMFYENRDEGGGIARVSRTINTTDGYILSGMELKVHNPPYVSEVFVSIRGRKSGKCLSRKMITNIFALGNPEFTRNEFIYSPVMKNFIKVVYGGYGKDDCASSVYLKYGTEKHG
ncbi:hypothetical protein [Novacetimonas cocois]|uniref:hypothetical protein n=1 Tax=Novacetimonas cocois TaxID=1747507 RepID=UPI001057B6D3|nr:hypothetical protein [Novacetimonas cocois]